MNAFRQSLALAVVTATLALPLVAQVGPDECFDWCHDYAMDIYDAGFPDLASEAFDDCMDAVCSPQPE